VPAAARATNAKAAASADRAVIRAAYRAAPLRGQSQTLAHESVWAYYSGIVARIAASLIATVVLALGVVGAGSSATRVRDLEAWARFTWNPPVGVTTHGYNHPLRVSKHVPPGMYRITILATQALGFQLIGPGINRRTPTCLGGPGSVPCDQREAIPADASWKVRLRRGTYRYRLVNPVAIVVQPPTSGSFKVP
jgi:hypothetical protein